MDIDQASNEMKHIFGPVPTHRLGRSLGIDPVTSKTCNWNCVYCQLGRTVPLQNERREYIPTEVIRQEIESALAKFTKDEVDWVTFVGSGETTLHTGLGELIRSARALTNIPIAVITNGSLLSQPEVREELKTADAVLPALDAGNADLYRKINRPWPKLTFEALVNGLVAFRHEYTGKLWIEVMLVKELNDTEEALREISTVLSRIHPDLVHLAVPDRPPAEPWVKPADEMGIMRAMAILSGYTNVVYPAVGKFEIRKSGNISDQILAIITRHPVLEQDLVCGLEKHLTAEEIQAVFNDLLASGKAQVVNRYGRRFICLGSAQYPPGK
jgi:wyosine [tRNA(Phe)-imidazoG37] synthetase (radical SAM superfamily)